MKEPKLTKRDQYKGIFCGVTLLILYALTGYLEGVPF